MYRIKITHTIEDLNGLCFSGWHKHEMRFSTQKNAFLFETAAEATEVAENIRAIFRVEDVVIDPVEELQA